MAIFIVWFICRTGPVPITDIQTRRQKGVGTVSPLQTGEEAGLVGQPSPGRLALVQMKEESYVPDYAAVARSRENLPFEFRGDGTSGYVIDRSGKLLMESGKEIGIFGIAVGPDKEHVLVKGGDGKNFVLTPASGEKLKLPVSPPGEPNMFSFDWDWIGARSLLGRSGVIRLGPNGKAVTTDDNVAESRLYVYDLRTQQLSEVTVPTKFTHAVFEIMEVIPDGHVRLGLDGAQSYSSWCKIDAP